MTAPGEGTAPSLLEVGRITRPHGLRGEVVVLLGTDREERLAPGTVLATDKGDLTVVAARRHQDRWIVSFAGHTSREAAEALRGRVLRAPAIDDPGELWVHDLVGAKVVTTAGVAVGTCVSVVANPASDLLELDSGALVPVVFVVDHTPTVVTVDPPEGLFDL
ncbi:MAG TPA: ribosome maturation factor RimM [Acidimicrobiales bacterium]|nr:ribosome maturation factor RimM [Acidimicrobiales bacterium]